MKAKQKLFFGAASVVVLGLLLASGCSSPTIPITMKVAGEIKLSGVSKIAFVDFNTLPGDAFMQAGVFAADRETCALVQRAVASAFYKSPLYQVAELSCEQAIGDSAEELNPPSKRFDALVYGRVWWQVMPETHGTYPKRLTLHTWENIPYTQKVLGVDVESIAKVTRETKDVLHMLRYRTQSATLMLSLAFYRVDGQGNISKIIDTYQVTEQGFTLMNGSEMKIDVADVGMANDGAVSRLQKVGKEEEKTAYEEMFPETTSPMGEALVGAAADAAAGALGAGLGGALNKKTDKATSAVGLGGLGAAVGGELASTATSLLKAPKKDEPAPKEGVDANGKVLLTQNTVTLPTELQAKLMLAARLSGDLAAKVAPTEVTFDSPWVDKRVLWMFDKRFDPKLTNLVNNRAWQATKAYTAYMIRQKVGTPLADTIESIADEKANYPVPPSEESFDDDELEDQLEYFADEEIPVYLYAHGIAQEALGEADLAYDTYTEAFNMKPTKEVALGISRCLMAMGQKARVNEASKAKSKASKKARMD